MGSVERRIEALEWSFGTSPREEDPEERRRLVEELKELEAGRPLGEKMAREEAEGNFARRRALEELEESVKRRMRARRS